MARGIRRRGRTLPLAAPVTTAASGVSITGAPRARRSATKAISSQARVMTTTNPASDPLSVVDSDPDSSSEADRSDYGSASKPTASNNRKGGFKRKAKKEVVRPQGDKKQLRYRESYGLAPETPPLSANADDHYTDLSKPSDDHFWADKRTEKNHAPRPIVPVVTVQVNGNAGGLGTINLNLADLLTSAGLKLVHNPHNVSAQVLTLADTISDTDDASVLTDSPATTDKTAGELKGILKLPRELRDRIYRLTLVRKAPIEFDSPSDLSRSAALLRTCKIIHEEGTEVLYGQNSFHFARSRHHRGKYYESSWPEIGYEDVRRFFETIGPVNISKMKYISFSMTNGHGRYGSPLTVPFPKFTYDPHLHRVFRLIGKHTILERFGFMFGGRGEIGASHFHLLNAMTDIQCYQLDIIGYCGGYQNRIGSRIEEKLRELMVVERNEEDEVEQVKKKVLVRMAYRDEAILKGPSKKSTSMGHLSP
ncbi:uncharacterized protein A1O9_03397 [Exophiala aquamarina CBS 119918]|uniref:Uncharacterized protein n=1 Tax=Exophiala aquamarina CBS 119918 TaxID=1182545 RepID=A0A072PQ40_9EURO|nr:uncharacterized protein A1O9_03397 [Exophiala aquamarina CBS 119918]KEF61827.1 hypothetical protein A1O9_03397 [Exophiala aquamarina CBS 119918]